MPDIKERVRGGDAGEWRLEQLEMKMDTKVLGDGPNSHATRIASLEDNRKANAIIVMCAGVGVSCVVWFFSSGLAEKLDALKHDIARRPAVERAVAP